MTALELNEVLRVGPVPIWQVLYKTRRLGPRHTQGRPREGSVRRRRRLLTRGLGSSAYLTSDPCPGGAGLLHVPLGTGPSEQQIVRPSQVRCCSVPPSVSEDTAPPPLWVLVGGTSEGPSHIPWPTSPNTPEARPTLPAGPAGSQTPAAEGPLPTRVALGLECGRGAHRPTSKADHQLRG